MKLTIPFYLHKVGAGFPSPATDYIEDDIDLNSYLITNAPATFIMEINCQDTIEICTIPGCVDIAACNYSETANTDAAFSKQQDQLKALEKQGYEVIEIHMDASLESGQGTGKGLIAPMPGKVIDIKVNKGKKVKAGDTLVILEAMKMEHSIKASEDGTVSELLISVNDQVENGALLMVVK